MKILVLGANGMAGHTISMYFIEKGHNVTTLTRRPFTVGRNININLCVNTLNELEELISNNKYDAVINSVGILNKDADDNKESAVFLNSYLPQYLSGITRESSTKIIHMSTDCVFSGKTGDYKEDSFTDGDTFYDRSKALGELKNAKDLTFRTSIIGPDINEDGIGLFNWFMKQTGEIKGFDQAIWTGVTTLTLAKAMEEALRQNLTGLYNLVNNDKINKFELLKYFNSILRNDELNIIPSSNLKLNKSLINTRSDFDFNIPNYKIMIEEMEEWIVKHKNIYPHYYK